MLSTVDPLSSHCGAAVGHSAWGGTQTTRAAGHGVSMSETNPTAQFLQETAALAAETERRANALEGWLTSTATEAWDAFLIQAHEQIGLPWGSTEYERSSRRAYYEVDLTAQGARFRGVEYHCGESDDVSYTIPWGFLDPTTREAVKADILVALRQEKERREKAAAAERHRQQEAQRLRDEAQLHDLARRLGKSVVEAQ